MANESDTFLIFLPFLKINLQVLKLKLVLKMFNFINNNNFFLLNHLM
jgi:hypothetical protein